MPALGNLPPMRLRPITSSGWVADHCWPDGERKSKVLPGPGRGPGDDWTYPGDLGLSRRSAGTVPDQSVTSRVGCQ